METIIGIVVGGLISWFITFIYFRKSKEEADNQGKDIKSEFCNLNEKVNIIMNSKNISKKEKSEKLNEISLELQSWISKLNSDPGEIENKINIKRNELKNENNKKSDLLRPYIIKVLDNIDIIINILNKTGKDITCQKLQLPANIYDSNINSKFKFNKIDRESIKIINFLDDIYITISNDEEKDLMKQNRVHFKFSINDNYKINLSINASNEFSFINEHYHFDIEQADTIYRESLKELFEYLVIKYSK